MDEPTTVKVGFSSGRGIGKAIRDITGGDINHAFILYDDPVLGVPVTFGANANGFTMVPISHFPDDIVRVFTPMPQPLLVGFRKNIQWINAPYDYGGLLGMAFVEAEMKILHWKAKNPFLDTQKLFCSEIVTKMLRDSGYDILPDQDAGTVDPWVLNCAMKERPDLYTRREMKE